MEFEFSTSNRIIFGEGKIQTAGKAAREFGTLALVVAGRGTALEPLLEALDDEAVAYEVVRIHGEPTVPAVSDILKKYEDLFWDLIIGIGGGSVLDTGKAVAALRTNPGDVLDYLEVVGSNKPLAAAPAPYIAIPTTAGTGSEVTRNAVLGVPSEKIKVSLRSPLMIPKVAIVDPALSLSAPPEVTASTGLDALAQVIEPFLSNKANPMTDLYCREGITRAKNSLRAAYADGMDMKARVDMAWVSLLGGLSLANAGLGAVHGFAGPIGGMFDAPHGMICARLLPLVFSANCKAIRQQVPETPALERFREVSCILCGSSNAQPEDGARWLAGLAAELRVPGLSQFGVQPADIPAIIEKSMNASSMKANPIRLQPELMREILYEAL